MLGWGRVLSKICNVGMGGQGEVVLSGPGITYLSTNGTEMMHREVAIFGPMLIHCTSSTDNHRLASGTLFRSEKIAFTITICLPDMSGIRMVERSLIAEWSAIQMGSE